MPRINVTLTTEVHTALKAESERTGVPIAEMIRQFIEQGLIVNGKPVKSDKVKWGGKR